MLAPSYKAKLLAGGTACEQGYAPVPSLHAAIEITTEPRKSLAEIEFRLQATRSAAEISLKQSREDRRRRHLAACRYDNNFWPTVIDPVEDAVDTESRAFSLSIHSSYGIARYGNKC
jgi:hypothetical protein